MEYTTGQIIKSEVQEIPALYHFGIIFIDVNKVLVMHHTVSDDSIIEPIEDYMEDRQIVEVINTPLMKLTNEELKARFLNCQGEFDAINYNCEHFVDCMLGHRRISEQLQDIALVSITGILLYIALSK